MDEFDNVLNFLENSLRLVHSYDETDETVDELPHVNRSMPGFIDALSIFRKSCTNFRKTLELSYIAIIRNSYDVKYEISEECPICLDYVKSFYDIPCKHKFCTICLEKWYFKRQNCPICKANL